MTERKKAEKPAAAESKKATDKQKALELTLQ